MSQPLVSNSSLSDPRSAASAEPGSATRPHVDLGSQASLQITVTRLNGRNYLEWAQSIKLAIDGRGKLGFLTGEEVQPADTDAHFRRWRSENSLITAWLLNSMEESIRRPYMYMSAKEIWDAARETYSNLENSSQIFELKKKLWFSKQGDRDVTTYYNEMLSLWQELDLCYNDEWENPRDLIRFRKREETDRVFMFLAGVNHSLDEVKGRILGRKPLPSIRETFSEIRQEEGRKRVMGDKAAGDTTTEFSALFTRENDGDLDSKKKFWCEFCKKPWHTKDKCWKLHGKPPHLKKKGDGKALATVSDQSPEQSHESEVPSFTKEQLERLYKILNSPQSSITPSCSFAHQGNPYSVALSVNSINGPWILDSGATDHMSSNSHFFSSYSPAAGNRKIKIADGSFSAIAGTGSIRLSPEIILNDVLHVPKLSCNLLSISHLTRDLNCKAIFYPSHCEFQDLASGRTIGNAKAQGGLYYFKGGSTSGSQIQHSCFGSVSSLNNQDVMLWHLRLGHPNFYYLKHLFPHLFLNKNPSSFQCEICVMAKHKRSSYPPRPYKPSKPFQLIHSDIWGPSRISTLSKKRWFVTFIDDHTRLSWVFLMKEKSEVAMIFQNFYSMIDTQFNEKIRIFRSDNGNEYFSTILGQFFSAKGILQQSSCIDTPQQNGVAERKNKHLLEVTRALLFTKRVPKMFWGDALLHATYLINRMPSKILSFKTPLQVLSQNYSTDKLILNLPMKIFGCTVFIHNPNRTRSKLDPKACKGIFLGFSASKKGYKCFIPEFKKYFVTMDASFFEKDSLFDPHLQGGLIDNLVEGDMEDLVFKEKDLEFLTDLLPQNSGIFTLSNSNPQSEEVSNSNSQNVETKDPSNPDSVEKDTSFLENNCLENQETAGNNIYGENSGPILETEPNSIERNIHNAELGDSRENPLNNEPQQSHESDSQPVPNPSSSHPTQRNNFGNLSDFLSDLRTPIALRKGVRSCTTRHPLAKFVSYHKLSPSFLCFLTQLNSVEIPKSIQEALQVPEWKEAVLEEMRALEKNRTWEQADLPHGKRAVGCKWVFTVKYHSDGTIERYKARLVAKGFTQAYGIDYLETFAPVAKLNTVRVLLSVAVNLDWQLQQLDVKNAFLNGELEEEVYMEPPDGFKEKFGSRVCRLRKSLYGLKQSPRAWFDRFTKFVKQQEYVQGQADHTLFFKRMKSGKIVVLIVYVDDIILTGDDEEEMKNLKGNLAREFEIKDLGKLKYFLGMEVARSKEGLVVSQQKYILDLLKETGMTGCKPIDTPVDPNVKLDITKDGVSVDTGRYQRLVGKLIYLSHTRPDIAFAVSLVSQFMHSPQSQHLEAAYRVLRYLKGTPGKGLFFRKNDRRGVEAFTDADWAGSSTDRRSTSGYCTYVWGNLVTWRSKKQNVVARSSAEAEYRAMANGICELIWLQRIMTELELQIDHPMKLYCDNKAAISIANNPVQHDRTKHVEIDRHFIKEKIEAGTICIPFIPTAEQTADILTKGLFKPMFESMVSKLGLLDIYAPT